MKTSKAFLKAIKKKPSVLINTIKPEVIRTFIFESHHDKIINQIMEDIKVERKIVIVSLSRSEVMTIEQKIKKMRFLFGLVGRMFVYPILNANIK